MNILTVRNAIAQIKALRGRNEFMMARLQMFDDMMLLFRSRPDIGTCRGMEEDICYLLEKEIESDMTPKTPILNAR